MDPAYQAEKLAQALRWGFSAGPYDSARGPDPSGQSDRVTDQEAKRRDTEASR
jgi:hypothetical protein